MNCVVCPIGRLQYETQSCKGDPAGIAGTTLAYWVNGRGWVRKARRNSRAHMKTIDLDTLCREEAKETIRNRGAFLDGLLRLTIPASRTRFPTVRILRDTLSESGRGPRPTYRERTKHREVWQSVPHRQPTVACFSNSLQTGSAPTNNGERRRNREAAN